MYNFIDTTESQSGGTLPSEALNFDGEYIENLIPGYRTLYVSGREVIDTELLTDEVGVRDGTRYRRKRYPERIITVGYQLIAKDVLSFRAAYNKLNAILDTDEAKLIFADEPDKYFIGTKEGTDDVPTGVNAVKSELTFHCADPFKYSVKEKEVIPTMDEDTTFVVDYRGTHKCFPVLEAEANGDIGFVGFIKQNGKVIQIGNADELDGENYEMSQTLVDEEFVSISPEWKLNSAKIIEFTNSSGGTVSTIQTGTVTVGKDRSGKTILGPSSYGNIVAYGGPSVTRQIPADQSGHVGAKNWTFSWHHNFTLTHAKQLGAVEFLVTGLKNGKKVTIASVTYSRNAMNTKAWGWFYVNNKCVKSYITIDDVTAENKVTGYSGGRSGIRKFGTKVAFDFAGQVFEFTDPEIVDVEATEISVFFLVTKGYDSMNLNGVYSVKFVSHSVESWRNVPNKFGEGDVILANCKAGTILVNGVEMQGLGALGNDWEQFFLHPGTNQINCVYSNWAEKPHFKLKYREVWL
jgi:predicted phage tail component-like protein